MGTNPNIVLPLDFKWRHFRFKLADGCWKKVKQRIKSIEHLQQCIDRYNAVDVYYSTSKWLQPNKIASKYECPVMLGNDLVFDIDAPEPITIEGLNRARKSAYNIYKVMKNDKRYILQYISFTGHKGFRLSYTDTGLILPVDYNKRIDYVRDQRLKFVEKIKQELDLVKNKKGFYTLKSFFDEEITTNPLCVVRVIGTGHSTTGFITTEIKVNQLRQNITKIINHIPYIGKKRPGIPCKREMTKGDEENLPRPRWHDKKVLDVSGLASIPHYFYTTNKVLGVRNRFIPVFIYQKNNQSYMENIKKLQKKYSLGNIYVFDSDNNIVCISCKTMQPIELQKVLNKSTSKTKYDFKKYRKIMMPLSLNLKFVITGLLLGQQSKGHLLLVDSTINPKQKGLCGLDRIELLKMEKKEVVV